MLLTKESIQNMSEENLCKMVLIRLLEAMKFRDVTYVHGGSAEQGKDIICWKEDELGSRRNYALVVKAVQLTGKAKKATGTASEVSTQIQQCFGKPYLDPITTELQNVHQCWVITNKKINKEAEEAIRSTLQPSGLDRNVQFIEGEKLWKYIEKYMPFESVWTKATEIGESLNNIDSHYQPRLTVGPNSTINVELVEKFPGASAEKPLVFTSLFKFPQTPEGEAARKAFEKYFDTGEPVDIPMRFLESVEVPDFLAPYISLENIREGVLHLGEVVNSPHVFVKIRIVCDDGDVAEIDYLDLVAKWSGKQRITLVNKELGNPFDIELELSPEQKTSKFKLVSRVDQPLNVYQIFSLYHFRYCFTKPGKFIIINRSDGLNIFEQKLEWHENPIPNEFLDELRDLVEVQIKVQRPIPFPLRDFSDKEAKAISHIRAIKNHPRFTRGWESLEITISPDDIEPFLEAASSPDGLFLQLTDEVKESLFGIEIPLGEVQRTFRYAKIENMDDLIGKKDDAPAGEGLKVRLVPNRPDSVVEVTYLDWIPDSTE